MSRDKSIFNQRNLTTGGFLGVIGLAVVMFPKVPGAVMSSGVAAYGSGIACATAFYRFRELMKDGTATENKFGDGFFAALAVVAGIGALSCVTYIVDAVKEATGRNEVQVAIFGLGIAVAGFFQARSTLLKDIKDDKAVERD